MLQTFQRWLAVTKQPNSPSFWLSHPESDWLMWKVCAEPTTLAGVGLWNSNSQEERPSSPVPPNPVPAHSLFLIQQFCSVHRSRMLGCKQCRRRQGGKWKLCEWWEGGRLKLGRQSKNLGLVGIKEAGHTGLNPNRWWFAGGAQEQDCHRYYCASPEVHCVSVLCLNLCMQRRLWMQNWLGMVRLCTPNIGCVQLSLCVSLSTESPDCSVLLTPCWQHRVIRSRVRFHDQMASFAPVY